MVEASTFTDPVLYNRVLDIQYKVNECLRDTIKSKSNNINWDTERIITELTKRECNDRLLVIMTVDEYEN